MFSRREWVVIVVLGLVVVAIYGSLVLLWVGQGIDVPALPAAAPPPLANSQPRPTPPWELLTAKEAHLLAAQAAREWRSDARLSSATAAWSQPTTSELTTGRTTWGFSFLSPSARAMAIVSVVGDDVQIIQARRLPQLPELLDATGWQVDSPLAVRIFLDHGGAEFLRDHPEADVHLRLSTRAEGRTILWMVSGLSADGQSSVRLRIDAITGRVVEQ